MQQFIFRLFLVMAIAHYLAAMASVLIDNDHVKVAVLCAESAACALIALATKNNRPD